MINAYKINRFNGLCRRYIIRRITLDSRLVRRLLFEMQLSASAAESAAVFRWKAEETLTELLLAEGAVISVRNSAGFIDRN